MAIGTPTQIANAVAQTGTTGGSGGTCVITTNVNASVGDLVIAVFARNDSTADLASVTDSAGNTWVIDKSQGDADPDPPSVYIARSILTNALNSGGTITGTYSSAFSSTRIGYAFKCSGIAASSPLDKTANGSTGAGGQGTAPAAGATGTLAQADELIVAAIASTGGAAGRTSTPGGSMVELADFQSGITGLAVQYQVVAATTTFTASATLSGTTFWTVAVATYKGAGGGSNIDKGILGVIGP